MLARAPRFTALLATMAILLAVVSAAWVRPAAAHDMPCCASQGHCDTPALGEPCCPTGQAPALPAMPTLTTPGKPGSDAAPFAAGAVVAADGPLPGAVWAVSHQGRFRPAHDPPSLLSLSLRI